MATRKADPVEKIITAAFGLAEKSRWPQVTLAAIAADAGMGLHELSTHVRSKSHIVTLFQSRMDRQLLASLDKDPVEGDAHDRLFDIIMRRLELLEPHKKAIASIIAQPGESTCDYAGLAASLLHSQGWLMAAAGLEDHTRHGQLKRAGLALVWVRTLKVWVDDDDAGLARTMAALDRHLRDGAGWLARLETPLALCTALGGLARGIMRGRRKPEPPPSPAPET